MIFPHSRGDVLVKERHFEIGMEVRAMNKVPGVLAFAGLVLGLDKEKPNINATIVDHKADEPFEAASINKLAIGLALAHLKNDQTKDDLEATVLTWGELTEPKGGGKYDQLGSPHQANIIELIKDMLSNSSNTAAIALVKLAGATNINRKLTELGCEVTQLELNDDETFAFGHTTARESLLVLRALVGGTDLSNDTIVTTSRDALINSTSTYGVRADLSGTKDTLANKTGQLNQDKDTPAALRHDVGVFYGPNGKEVMYAFFSRSASDTAAKAATLAIADLGRLLAKEAGIEQVGASIATRRDMGKAALKAIRAEAHKKALLKMSNRSKPRFKK